MTLALFRWNKAIGEFSMAVFRFLCIKKPEIFQYLGIKNILKMIYVGHGIVIFFSLISNFIIDLAIKTPVKDGFCYGNSELKAHVEGISYQIF